MGNDVIALKGQKEYAKITAIAHGRNPQGCNLAEEAQAIGTAYEKQSAFSQSLPWYLRSFDLNPSDEVLGMVLGVCFALGDYKTAEKILDDSGMEGEYYYSAGRYELAFRTRAGTDAQIEALETFLDIQEEETYMLRLATLYVQAEREREAGRICKKLVRLFMSGESVEYAERFQEAIKEEQGLSFVNANPWTKDAVFKHLSFDLNAPKVQDVTITAAPVAEAKVQPAASAGIVAPQAKPKASDMFAATISKFMERKPKAKTEEKASAKENKKEVEKLTETIKEKVKEKEKESIAPIIEKSLESVIGMKELKESMNNVFNIMQADKKRAGVKSILYNNIVILGPDGCGKTTAAIATAKVLCDIGIITEEIPEITDYDALVGATNEDTHENIQKLFENAVDSCILIENIHEFADPNKGHTLGLEAIDELVKAYEASGRRIPLVITGSPAEVEKLLENKRKFGDFFNLPRIELGKYTTEELVKIANKIAEDKRLIIEDEAKAVLATKLERLAQQQDFKFSRDLDKMVNTAYINRVNSLSKVRRVSANDYYLLKAENFDFSDMEETVEELLEQLDRLIGLASVKEQVKKIVSQVRIQKMREETGTATGQGFGSLHLLFLGNAGTGKTTVARIIGKIYKRLGVLPSGQLVEVGRSDLVAGYVGQTAQKTKDKIKEAMGGILFIDEAYTLATDSFGKEAIDTLVADMENNRSGFMVILAGYSDDMHNFMDQNQGLRSRIPKEITFEDYSVDEMVQIFKKYVKDKGMYLDAGLDETLYQMIETASKKKDFGNARGVRNLFESVYENLSVRLAEQGDMALSKNDLLIIKKEDLKFEAEETEDIGQLLEQLNNLIGLDSAKDQVRKIINQVKVQKMREEAGASVGQGFGSLHMLFLGNAGTGKTTVARIVGKIYQKLGVLSTGQLVECGRSDLVAGYVGQTAIQTKDKIKEAMGGILFIDEAYTLATDSFGKEAIDTLVADMENNRNDFMVILAGYSDDMQKFMDQNQGLRSRIPRSVLFEDYSLDEMVQIFGKYVSGKGMHLEEGCEETVRKLIEKESKKKDFGNARGVRNVFEAVVENQSVRLGETDAALISPDDFYVIKKEDLMLKKAEGQDNDEEETVERLLEQLNSLIGLASVKEQVGKMVASVRVNQKMREMGLTGQKLGTLHMVFKGNAGTGKTTVARIIGKIYRKLGVLPTGQLVECGRSDLVAGYVGQTALQVKEKVKEAMGGVLFIDEAYTLATDTFGKEAIDTLVADIENYRDNLMVIIAGYSEDMDVFLEQNQGLKSRFPNEIMFDDYTMEEMLSIFKSMVKGRDLILADESDALLIQAIEQCSKEKAFGNARGIRNMVDRIVENRAVRIAARLTAGEDLSVESLRMITDEDIRFLIEN